jgi:hypothetical protein
MRVRRDYLGLASEFLDDSSGAYLRELLFLCVWQRIEIRYLQGRKFLKIPWRWRRPHLLICASILSKEIVEANFGANLAR